MSDCFWVLDSKLGQGRADYKVDFEDAADDEDESRTRDAHEGGGLEEESSGGKGEVGEGGGEGATAVGEGGRGEG